MYIINQKLKHCFSILAVVAVSSSLLGCDESSVKRDPPAPAVDKKFTPDGHIQLNKTVDGTVVNSSSIPSVVGVRPVSLPALHTSPASFYSVTAVNVPAGELFYQVARDAGKQIDLYKGIKGRVTINAINQPLEKILERISDQVGLMYSITNGVIQIKPDIAEWRNYKIDYVNINKKSKDTIDLKMAVSGAGGASTGGSSTSVTVESEHDFWKSLEDNIKLLAQFNPDKVQGAEGGEVGSTNTAINSEAGVISVYTTGKKHKSIQKYIDEVSLRSDRQVLIEATVVEVILNDKFQAGIDWTLLGSGALGRDGGFQISSPFDGPGSTDGFSIATISNAGSAAVGAVSGDWNIISSINLLQEFGDTRVLSSPKIMAINNQTALLKVVENLVYFTVDVNVTAATTTTPKETTYETEIHTVPIGFTMSVTPFVSDDDDITLNIRPTISRHVRDIEDPNPELKIAGVTSSIPVVQEKEMSSVLRLKDRQTAVIGGLIEDRNDNLRTGLPWLGDLPFIGDLFAQREDQTQKTELLIFIRPIIVKNPDVDTGDLQQLGRFLKTNTK